jgi:putative transposase
MVAYIDEHREEYGVEPICAQLPIAPATYRRHKNRMPSRREQDDERLATEVARVFEENYGVYGRRKVWAQLNREGIRIGRDHTERLMKRLGISGAVRGRKVRTTTPDASAPRAPDLVERDWAGVDRPNAVWVSDFTYVATWAGIVYVAFVIDVYSRRIVGWRAATNMRTELVLDALEHALWARNDRLDGLICHSDAGSQYTSIRYTERLATAGAVPSIGSVGDPIDNAVAETTIGIYKTELIRRRGPWRNIDQVDIATLEYVDWFNHRRLHGQLGMIPPAEFDASHYRQIPAPIGTATT